MSLTNQTYQQQLLRYPEYCILDIRSTVGDFVARMTGLHQPAELAISFLIYLFPAMTDRQNLDENFYALSESLLCEPEHIETELENSNIPYSVNQVVENFHYMFLHLSAVLQTAGLYDSNGVFPYEVDHPRSIVMDGVRMKKISIEKYLQVIHERPFY